jgi:hypothetical protein
MSRAVRHPRALAVLLTLLSVALAGCVSLPDGGGVESGARPDQEAPSDPPIDYSPSAPRKGASPLGIVNGFLDAMTAAPVTNQYALKFLTEAARNSWVPEDGTIVYGSETPAEAGRFVTLELTETIRLDGRGTWLGNTSGGRDVSYEMELVEENGEWRINNPPNAMMVPQSHFESRYQQCVLYFFDKTAQVLVPEPVYLPRGDQAATMLVRGLLRGADQHLLGAERTFLPAGTELEISAPVQADGTADVPLSDEILDLNDDNLDRAMAQLGWTLGQVPGVERMRITVDGSPLDVPTRGLVQDVHGWPEYDPSVNWASQELFGIRDGHVINLVGDLERRIAGIFGSEDYGLRSIAVDLPAEQVAGVSGDGTTVMVAPRTRESGEVPAADSVNVVYESGTDLLRPAWDLYGKVWLVDRTAAGAALSVVSNGTATPFTVPGISGEQVKAFVVSRDGTRLVAVVDAPRFDRLWSTRIMRTDTGEVRRIAPAEELPVGAIQVNEIRDIAWRTPGSVALLTGPVPGLSQVVVALIDGSSALGDVATNAELFRNEARRIVTSPSPGSSLYVGTKVGQLFQLAANGRWTGTSIKGGLRSPTFVG